MELTSMETTTPQWSVQDVISTLTPNHMTAVTGLDCQNADAAALAQTLQSILTTPDPSVFASQMQLMQAVTGSQAGANQVMLMPQPDGLQWMMHQYPMMFVPSGWTVQSSAESPSMTSGEAVLQAQPPLYTQAVQLQFPDGLRFATVAAHQQNPEFQNGSSVSASPVPKTSTSNSPVPVGMAMNQQPVQLANGTMGLGQQSHVQVVQPGGAVTPQSQVSQQPSAQTDSSAYGLPVGYTANRQELCKPELPKPPKKPLSPYMSFSKAIWSKVKGANPSMSVCEVGAAIGRLWRELDDTEKQRYNNAFTNDKARYDVELQSYLKVTGLQASDLVKPRTKKNHPKPPAPAAQQPRPVINAVTVPISQPQQQQQSQQQSQQQVPSEAALGASGETSSFADMARVLPHFSQVWTGQQQYLDQQLLAQLGQAFFTNCDGTVNFVGLQPQAINIADERQLTVLYGQNQELSQPNSNANQQLTDLEKVTGASSTSTADTAMVQRGTDVSWQWHTLPTEGTPSSGQLSSAGQHALQVNDQGFIRTLIPRTDSEVKPGDGGPAAAAAASQSPAIDASNSFGSSESQWNQLEPAMRLSLLEKELHQMRAALSEKTQEAQLLMQQLEQANRIIEQLQRRRTRLGQEGATAVRSTEPSAM